MMFYLLLGIPFTPLLYLVTFILCFWAFIRWSLYFVHLFCLYFIMFWNWAGAREFIAIHNVWLQ